VYGPASAAASAMEEAKTQPGECDRPDDYFKWSDPRCSAVRRGGREALGSRFLILDVFVREMVASAIRTKPFRGTTKSQ
jgi:hypothetical protein